MAAVAQEAADDVVARCRAIVARFGQGNPALAKLRSYYEMFHACPEGMSLALVEGELDKLEAEAA